MKANKIIIVPETHWDREWYLPFQEYRARLVLMMDKLLKILETDPNYKNFTFDGQTIPLEDYLEVKPEKEEELKKYIKNGRLSVGPMHILPDEFLISGESIIRNLMIGHQIAESFGKVMKAGYIPDPFGHIAQLPQILSGCDIPSVLFWRGFGDEFEANNLNMEFRWNAPGNAASILAIHLVYSYGSLADLNTSKASNGKYKKALRKIRRTVKKFENHIATPVVLLNSGSDHHEAKAELPEIIKQWNEENPDQQAEQNDFEYYVNEVSSHNPTLKEFQGELRGGKYAHLLSGVLSARMWIKQRNTQIEYLYEKYAEPLATITWALDKHNEYEYPSNYLLTGYKWLIKNHPHDSICGCSIDQVHDEMKTRFDWAEQIAVEVYKNSFLYLSDLITTEMVDEGSYSLIVFNPLPWNRTDVVKFNGATMGSDLKAFNRIEIKDASSDEKVEYQHFVVEEKPRYTQERNVSHEYSFISTIPACGYKAFKVCIVDEEVEFQNQSEELKMEKATMENKFYKIYVDNTGKIDIEDKSSGVLYDLICGLEDLGDWGDEYDYSGPKDNQLDMKFTSKDARLQGVEQVLDGPSHKMLQIRMILPLPLELSEERYSRSNFLVENKITIFISLYKNIKRVDFKVQMENKSKDHRIRMLFPTKIKTDRVHVDGHFQVITRDVQILETEHWAQKPLPTNHQKDFIAVQEDKTCFAVLNKGLPEYEAIKEKDGTITLAITLLRCVEWLSRGDFASRASNAGPDIKTPGAQCLGEHEFELSLIIDSKHSDWIEAEIPALGKEFNCPLMPIIPFMTNTPLRILDRLILTPLGVLSYFITGHKRSVEPHLPLELSFLGIDNKKVQLSILKKSENGGHLIIRCYNLAFTSQIAKLNLQENVLIKEATIVNFLEEQPNNPIKATIEQLKENVISLKLEPHVIATIKIKFERK